eukprot:COSAG05_NODE_3699_length_1894_cov_398.942714_3_plen_87_part_01
MVVPDCRDYAERQLEVRLRRLCFRVPRLRWHGAVSVLHRGTDVAPWRPDNIRIRPNILNDLADYLLFALATRSESGWLRDQPLKHAD